MICHQDIRPVSSHICHMLQRSYLLIENKKQNNNKKTRSDQYKNDMPPCIFMYHFAPLTCCKTISKEGGKENEGWGGGRGGGEWGMTYSKVICTHGIDSQQVQWLFDLNFICSKTAGICGVNLWSTTVVSSFNECSPTCGDPSQQGKLEFIVVLTLCIREYHLLHTSWESIFGSSLQV